MKKKYFLNIISIFFLCNYGICQQPVDYVNTEIGTHDARPMLFPGATMPFGMVKLSPDNKKSGWKGGHEYTINSIAGFNFIHSYHVTGFYVMPVVGKIKTQPGSQENPDEGYRSRITHDSEWSSPGYYSVILKDYHIKAELSATTRTGIQRYTFPKSNEAAIMFAFQIPYEDPGKVLDVMVHKVSNTEIEGYIKVHNEQIMGNTIWLNQVYNLYFVTRVDKPFESLGGWKGDSLYENISSLMGNGDVGCYLRYKTSGGEQINVQTALSMVSLKQARLNLDKETRAYGFKFNSYKESARKVWNELLGKVKVFGGSNQDKIKFYTNLYRCYSAKSTWSDVNGKWMDMNGEVTQTSHNQVVYGSDAFWGMKWDQNGLWSLVNPSIMNSWVNSMLEIYKRGGWLPKGPTVGAYTGIMTGSPAVEAIVAAYEQDIRGYDVGLAYEAISKIMKEQGRVHKSGGWVGNRWLKPYMDYGYVPNEIGPASNTMELAFQDWCVAQMAKSLGKEQDYEYFLKRSQNYKNQLDTTTLYARPKSTSGIWVTPFNPYSGEGFIEGNGWQYTYYAPHDVQGIINFLGKDKFSDRLENGFISSESSKFNASGDQYAKFPINHGNEPNMEAAFLFNYCGEPWLTQKWERKILDIYYGDTPMDGWPGDEDEGQMGAWFVMSSLGLFQMQGGCGIHPIFDIGSPLFKKTIVKLENGKLLNIIGNGNSKKNVYIQSAKLNGKVLNRPWIYFSEVRNGGTLEYVMGETPNKSWGITALPPSMSKPGPFVDEEDDQLIISTTNMKDEKKMTFMDTAVVRMKTNMPNSVIRYTTNGAMPAEDSPVYNRQLNFGKSAMVSAMVFDRNGNQLSKLRSVRLHKLNFQVNLTTGQRTFASSLNGGYDSKFAVDGFVDRDHFWDAGPYPQWWEVELKEPEKIKELQLFTYWDDGRYYQYTIDASVDGKTWTKVVDASKNKEIATKDGYTHLIKPIIAKWFRVNMLFDSANEGVHISEFRVYK